MQTQTEQLSSIIEHLKSQLDMNDRLKNDIKDQKKTVEQTRDCLLAIKVRFEKMETHFSDFAVACGENKGFCAKKFELIDAKLASIPSQIEVSLRDAKIDKLVKSVDALTADFAKFKVEEFGKFKSDDFGKFKLKIYTVIGVINGVAIGLFGFLQWWYSLKGGA